MAEKNAEKVETVEEVKAPKVEIIRGRMPLPIVHMIKFSDEAFTDGALATQFRTTNGKISDVRKGRNFGYVGEDYVPSAEMIEKAKVYAAQLDDKEILKAVNKLKPANDEQNAAFDTARKASRPAKTEKVEAPAEPVSDEELSELTE